MVGNIKASQDDRCSADKHASVCGGVFMRGLCVRHTDECLRTNPLRRVNLCVCMRVRFVVSKIKMAQNNECRQ